MRMKEVHGGNIYKFDHKVYDFSANLNPLGMPEEVKHAIIENIDKYESYPDPFNRELTAAIGRFHGVSEDRICCGNGAADIIFRIPLALRPKEALIVSPTFSEYEEALGAAGCKIRRHLLTEEKGFILDETVLYAIDPKEALIVSPTFSEYEEALGAAGCKIRRHLLTEEKGFILDETVLYAIDETVDMMFLCNPNNPTGIPVGKELVLSIAEKCRACGAVLVIDECFTEFLDEEEFYSVMSEIAELPNVIILKAFTKIYAMAGLRLGYCICGCSETAEKIRSMLQPWAVSTAASKAGCAALTVDGFIEKTKEYIRKNRQVMTEALKRLGYRVYDTKANYIFFRSETELVQPLREFDIMIRSCAKYITLDEHYYRVAVRTEDENAYLILCLEKIAVQQK